MFKLNSHAIRDVSFVRKSILGRCYEKLTIGRKSRTKLTQEKLLSESLHHSPSNISEHLIQWSGRCSPLINLIPPPPEKEDGTSLPCETPDCGGPTGMPGTKLSRPEPVHSAPGSSQLLRAPILSAGKGEVEITAFI